MIIWVLVFFNFSMPGDVLIMEAFKLPYVFSSFEQCRETEDAFHRQTEGLITHCLKIKKPDFFL